jgi:hypothetical protein
VARASRQLKGPPLTRRGPHTSFQVAASSSMTGRPAIRRSPVRRPRSGRSRSPWTARPWSAERMALRSSTPCIAMARCPRRSCRRSTYWTRTGCGNFMPAAPILVIHSAVGQDLPLALQELLAGPSLDGPTAIRCKRLELLIKIASGVERSPRQRKVAGDAISHVEEEPHGRYVLPGDQRGRL